MDSDPIVSIRAQAQQIVYNEITGRQTWLDPVVRTTSEAPTKPVYSASASAGSASAFFQANLALGSLTARAEDFVDGPFSWSTGSGVVAVRETLTFLNPLFDPSEAPVEVNVSIQFKRSTAEQDASRGNWSIGPADDLTLTGSIATGIFGERVVFDAASLRLADFVVDVPVFLSVVPFVNLGGTAEVSLDLDIGPLPDGVSFTSKSGYFLRSDLYAPETVIVLTHGWQPGADVSEEGTPRLPQVRAALEERLEAEGIRDEVLIYEFSWPEAFTPTSPGDYSAARAATAAVGDRLSDELIDLFAEISDATGEDYEPNLHFIGHSLGTMVNAEAVEDLTSRATKRELGYQVEVDQVTILDSPLNPSRSWRQFYTDHEDYFFQVLDTEHLAYVENFYATETSIQLWPFEVTPSFGQPIDGTGPRDGRAAGGLELPGDHITMLDAYADIVRGESRDPAGGDWTSPALDGWRPEVRWSTRPDGETITGNKLSNTLTGTNDNDRIFGRSGNDTIRARDGNDMAFGERGRDDLRGRDGEDTLVGGGQNDTLYGQLNDDLLAGEQGRDQLDGGSGNDTLIGGPGTDTLLGGRGADAFVLSGSASGHDEIRDFNPRKDLIALTEGLTRAELDASRKAGNTELRTSEGDLVAILTGVSPAALDDATWIEL